MSPDDIPWGTTVLFDTNALIYAKRALSVQCRNLLTRCTTGEVKGFVTVIALAEFCHRRMMQEAQLLGLAGSNPARALAQNRVLLQRLSRYRREVENLLKGSLVVIDLTSADMIEALGLQTQFGLLTNDSLHLAAARRANIQHLVSSDPQFDSVPGLTRYAPTDIVIR